MKPPMLQTCTKVSAVRNEYGDILSDGTAGVAHSVRWRQQINQNRGTNMSEITSDAMVWAEPDAGFAIDDILLYDGAYYRIKQVDEARDLDTTEIHFLKCLVERTKDTSGVS